jgi:archaemetzincin
VPFGRFDRRQLDILQDRLPRHFLKTEVKVADPIEIPENSFVTWRRQFLAEEFLSCLLKILPEEKNLRILGVTDRDLFAPGLNFVFGQAFNRVAVISTFRLRDARGSEAESGLLQLRMLKEAVHELGHTFGLEHCPIKSCVMHFSNTLLDTDFKSEHFCQECGIKVRNRIEEESS